MHGGAYGSGARRGNRNAFRHGLYTKATLAHRRRVNRILRNGTSLLRQFEKRSGRAPDHVPRDDEWRPDEARRRPRDGPPGRIS